MKFVIRTCLICGISILGCVPVSHIQVKVVNSEIDNHITLKGKVVFASYQVLSSNRQDFHEPTRVIPDKEMFNCFLASLDQSVLNKVVYFDLPCRLDSTSKASVVTYLYSDYLVPYELFDRIYDNPLPSVVEEVSGKVGMYKTCLEELNQNCHGDYYITITQNLIKTSEYRDSTTGEFILRDIDIGFILSVYNDTGKKVFCKNYNSIYDNSKKFQYPREAYGYYMHMAGKDLSMNISKQLEIMLEAVPLQSSNENLMRLVNR